MRWLTIAVALTAFVLVSAGCGGDDEAASDTTTLTDTTTEETTTEETTTEETTTDDSGDLGGLASGECAELVEAGTQLSQALGAGTSSANLEEVSAFYDEVVEKAPDEIRADVQILADAWVAYADVLADVQVEPGQTPDAEALAALQQALASIDQQEVSAAATRISAWTTENCPTG
jgi:hypothetical protein